MEKIKAGKSGADDRDIDLLRAAVGRVRGTCAWSLFRTVDVVLMRA
jgi:hypothetical protein